MNDRNLNNADVLAGQGASRAARAYRELASEHGHDELCDAYGLDRGDVRGGTHWTDVVAQAYWHGDINSEGGLT